MDYKELTHNIKKLTVLLILCCLFFISTAWAQEETNSAIPDSIKYPKQLDLKTLNAIAAEQVKNGLVKSSVEDISDGIVQRRFVVESKTEIAFIWLDPYNGEIRYIGREEKELSLEDQKQEKEAATADKDNTPVDFLSRRDAEKIAHAQVKDEAGILRSKKIMVDGQSFFEVTLKTKKFGARKQTFLIAAKTGRIELSDDDPVRQIYNDRQESLRQRQSHKIKLSAPEAEEIALKAIPGKAISTELKKKRGEIYYQIQIFTEDKEIREVKVHAKKGSSRILK